MSGSSAPSNHLFWIASRSLGIAAIVLLSASIAFGLALSGRMSQRPGASARLKTIHEALSLTALGTIVAHGLTLLGDSYLDPGLAGISIPFVIPVSPAWTGLGVIAGWMALILGLSYYARRRIGTARWKRIHRWNLLAWALGVVHTLGAGTDAGSPWFLALLGVSVVPVIVVGVARLAGPGADPRRAAQRAI